MDFMGINTIRFGALAGFDASSEPIEIKFEKSNIS